MVRKNNIYALIIAAACVSSFLSGCMGTAQAPKEIAILFPAPPEEPRVAYIGSYKGEADFKGDSVLVWLFGTSNMLTLQYPFGVSSSGDTIYAIDKAAASIVAFDTKNRSVFSTKAADEETRLARPMGIAAAADGTIFVTDAKNKNITALDAELSVKFSFGEKAGLNNPVGIAVYDEAGRIYVTDSFDHCIAVFSVKGDFLFKFGSRGSAAGQFNYPSGVAVDKKTGKVYVLDTQNFRVQVFDKDGAFLSMFGQPGDSLGSFTRPKGIGIDNESNIYVLDSAFQNIQVFDENWRLLLVIGSGGAKPGYFALPSGLYVDAKNRIYVADTLNGRVQIYQYMSDQWKKENPMEFGKYMRLDEEYRAEEQRRQQEREKNRMKRK